MSNKLPLSITSVQNEAELLLKVAEGDQRAFACIFNAYHDALFQFILTSGGDRELAKETLLDVFTSVWLCRTDLPSLNSFIDWLFIVTRNQLIRSLRKRRSSPKVVRLEDHPRQYTDDKAQEHEYEIIMQKAIEQLPPQQQQAFRLSRIEGYDNHTIAKEMGIAPDSVKKYLQWAQQSVARFVESNTGIVIFISFLQAFK